jgi:hydrogenase maturation protease
MASLPLPEDVEVYDAGTVGIEVSWELEGRSLVVVVDAIEAGAEPGAVFRFTPAELQPWAIGSPFSLHGANLFDALEQTRLLDTAPKEVAVLAVQVGDVSWGLGLSPPVAGALEKVLHLAGRILDVTVPKASWRSTQPIARHRLRPEGSLR